MEKLKIKHDHKLTDILKVGIFCLFLILPILLFLPNCLYYGFNEHATNTETTTINYKYQSNEVNMNTDIVEGNIYNFTIENNVIDDYFVTGTDYLYLEVISVLQYNFNNYDISIDDIVTNLANEKYENVKLIFQVGYDALSYFDLYFTNLDGDYFIDNLIGNLTNDSFTFMCIGRIIDFNFTGNEYEIFSYTDYNVIESVEVNTDNTITTQIGNSWASLWETPFLQWTDNNNFQFTINSFCNVFGITQESYITNYLTYILTMTCIYLVFDIVISISTKLTHMLTNSKD